MRSADGIPKFRGLLPFVCHTTPLIRPPILPRLLVRRTPDFKTLVADPMKLRERVDTVKGHPRTKGQASHWINRFVRNKNNRMIYFQHRRLVDEEMFLEGVVEGI
jgi:hypothetical protein